MQREVPISVAILVIVIAILLAVGVGWWYLNRSSTPLQNPSATISPVVPGSPQEKSQQPQQQAQPNL